MAPVLKSVLLVLLVIALNGCPTLDVSQPIALVPDEDLSSSMREKLQTAAECWNLKFGTRLSVGNGDGILQQVRVGFSEFVEGIKSQDPAAIKVAHELFSRQRVQEFGAVVKAASGSSPTKADGSMGSWLAHHPSMTE